MWEYLGDLNEEKQRMEKVIQERQTQDKKPEKIQVEQVKKMIEDQVKTVLDAISILPVEEAKAMLSTLVSKVTVLGEKELEIEISFS